MDRVTIHHSSMVEQETTQAPELFKYVPSELLLYNIFPALDGCTFVRCRRVCKRWRAIVDELQQKWSQKIWKAFTVNDYSDIFEGTLNNCSNDMSWFQIYKNLSLWPRIGAASCTHAMYELVPETRYEMTSVRINKHGLVTVLHREFVSFYDLQTLERYEDPRNLEEHQLWGNYRDYQENEIAIAVLTLDENLHITRKIYCEEDVHIMYEAVTLFVLHKGFIFVQMSNSIYKIDLSTRKVASELLIHRDLEVGLFIVNDALYARIDGEQIMCVDINGSGTTVGIPQSLEDFTGLFGSFCPNPASNLDKTTASRSRCLDRLLKSNCWNLNDGSIDSHTSEASLYSKKEMNEESKWIKLALMKKCFNKMTRFCITVARIYNNMLLLGSVLGVVYIIKIPEFKILREFQMPLIGRSNKVILDIKIHESSNRYDVVVLNKNCIYVIRLKHNHYS